MLLRTEAKVTPETLEFTQKEEKFAPEPSCVPITIVLWSKTTFVAPAVKNTPVGMKVDVVEVW